MSRRRRFGKWALWGLGTGRGGVTLYLDTVNGNDANNALTFATARQTLASVLTLLSTNYNNRGSIHISAPSTAPALGFFTMAAGVITLRGYQGANWYCERTSTWTSGWAAAGGGIYTRTTGGGTAGVFVPTLLDGNNFATCLAKNTATPSTPAAGQYGVVTTTLYVHLPGDANPNSHTVKQVNAAPLITINGTAHVTLRQGVFQYTRGLDACVLVAGSAVLNTIGCYFDYGETGLATDSTSPQVTASDCYARRAVNDGFNHNAGTMVLTRCDGSYNDDEGVSPHATSILYVNGGRYHHNNSSGMTAANSARAYLDGAEFDTNNQSPPTGEETFGGITYGSTSGGTCANCHTHNNGGPGFVCSSSDHVTVTDLNSHDNTGADSFCP